MYHSFIKVDQGHHVPYIYLFGVLYSKACMKQRFMTSKTSKEAKMKKLISINLVTNQTTTTITTILRPFFRDHPGELVPEENFWTSRCKGRLTEADTPTIWLGTTPSALSSAHLHHPPCFYGPDALPAAQPTVSKH